MRKFLLFLATSLAACVDNASGDPTTTIDHMDPGDCCWLWPNEDLVRTCAADEKDWEDGELCFELICHPRTFRAQLTVCRAE